MLNSVAEFALLQLLLGLRCKGTAEISIKQTDFIYDLIGEIYRALWQGFLRCQCSCAP